MICYMLRHRFRDEFYFKPSPRQGAVMKAKTGTLFKTKWGAKMALDNTKLQNLQIVEVHMEIKAVS